MTGADFIVGFVAAFISASAPDVDPHSIGALPPCLPWIGDAVRDPDGTIRIGAQCPRESIGQCCAIFIPAFR